MPCAVDAIYIVHCCTCYSYPFDSCYRKLHYTSSLVTAHHPVAVPFGQNGFLPVLTSILETALSLWLQVQTIWLPNIVAKVGQTCT